MCDRMMTLHCNECNQWVVFYITHQPDGCYASCTNCNDMFFISLEEVNIKIVQSQLAALLALARQRYKELGKLNTLGDHINPPDFHDPFLTIQN